MITPMQQKILDMLPATVTQIVLELDISRRAAEHYLEHLKADKLIWYNKTDRTYEVARTVATFDEPQTTTK